MNDPREKLRDILEAVERIERYVARGREEFDNSELVQTWIVHHLQIVGEAAARIGREFHETHPEIPWPQIIAMRNVLVHDYFGIDSEEVWVAAKRDLPPLKRGVEALLSALEGENG